MKRNCYLDHRFHPSSVSSSSNHSMNGQLNGNIMQLIGAIPHYQNNRLTFDITELQARVIIWLASKEMEERNGNKGALTGTMSFSLEPQALLMHGPQGFSIKRSLRNFLQKRKRKFSKLL